MRSHSNRGFRRDRGPRRDRSEEREPREPSTGETAAVGTAVDLSELVRFLAAQLADQPDEVRVTMQEGQPTLYELRVASEEPDATAPS